MLRSLFAIITNTFKETLRQPVYGVVVAATVLLLVFSPSLAMFTLKDDNQLLKDVALSTLLVAGLFLAVFAATTVVFEEIENKTILTVVSKTVSRPLFLIGKFLGVAAAVLLAQYFLALVLLIIVRHGVMQTASDEPDRVVITLSCSALALTFLVGLGGNLLYRWRFSSTAILLATVLATIVVALLAFIDPHWQYHPSPDNLDWNLIGSILLTIISSLIFTSIAVAASTRLGQITTLIVCALMFVAGAMVQYLFGPIAASSAGLPRYLAWLVLGIVPSTSFYVATNPIYTGGTVPFSYVGQTGLYALLYVTAVMLFAIGFFRRQEIG